MGLPISGTRVNLLTIHAASQCSLQVLEKTSPAPSLLAFIATFRGSESKVRKTKMDDAVSRALKDHEKPLKPIFLESHRSLPAFKEGLAAMGKNL